MSKTRVITKAERYGITPSADHIGQRISKMLLEYPLSKDKIRFEVIRMALYTPRLLGRGALNYGWMSAVPLKHHSKEKRKLVNDKIAAIEKSDLSAYEKVGQITDTIKKELGLKFISDGTFKEMMNTKFLEYTLQQEMKTREVNCLQDALDILDEHSEMGRPTTLLAAHPEIFDLRKSTERQHITYRNPAHSDTVLQTSPNPELTAAIKSALIFQQAHSNLTKGKEDLQGGAGLSFWLRENSAELIAKLKAHKRELNWPKEVDAPEDEGFFVVSSIERQVERAAQKHDRETAYIEYLEQTLKLFEKEVLEDIKHMQCHTPDPLSANLMAATAIPQSKRWPMLHIANSILAIDKTLGAQEWIAQCTNHIKGVSQTPFTNDGLHMKGLESIMQTTRERIEKFIGPVDWSQDQLSYLGSGKDCLPGAATLQGLLAIKPRHKPTPYTEAANAVWKAMRTSNFSRCSTSIGYISSDNQIDINHKRNMREKEIGKHEHLEPLENEWANLAPEQAIERHMRLFWARRHIGAPNLWGKHLQAVDQILTDNPHLVHQKNEAGNSILQICVAPPGKKLLNTENEPDHQLVEMIKRHGMNLNQTNYYGATIAESLFCLTPEDIEKDATYNNLLKFAQAQESKKTIEDAFMSELSDDTFTAPAPRKSKGISL